MLVMKYYRFRRWNLYGNVNEGLSHFMFSEEEYISLIWNDLEGKHSSKPLILVAYLYLQIMFKDRLYFVDTGFQSHKST